MDQRIDYYTTGLDGVKGLMTIERAVRKSGLEPSLLELVKMRASQINGCARCIEVHSKDARKAGESEQRLYGLDAWREAPYYSDRERAALAWTEALTGVTQGHVSDDVYEEARRYFSEKELVDLSFAIIAINSRNRLAIAFRSTVGSYEA